MSTLEISQAPSAGRDDDATCDNDGKCDDVATCDDDAGIESRREEQSSGTGFLSLPPELRDRIYDQVIPFGNLHIDYYNPNGYTIPGRRTGFGHIFCQQEPESDHIAGTTWLEGNDDIQGHQKRHTSTCFNLTDKNGNCSRPRPRYRHPFALLFVCRQTFVDLCARMYKRNAFTFQDLTYLHAFVSQASDAMVRNIQDLRLALRMGDKGIVHSEPVLSVEICSALTGLRRLHISLELCIDGRNAAEERRAPNKVQLAARRLIHLKRILTKHWRSLHWVRFGSLPLEDFTIVVDTQPLCKDIDFSLAEAVLRTTGRYGRFTESDLYEQARFWASIVHEEFLKTSDQKSMLERFLGL